jgi:hypothetical protein
MNREQLGMAHEQDDPRDVADDVQYVPQSLQDSLTTKLTPAEQRLGATSRKVAFFILAASVLPAAVGAVFWWYMWVVTVQNCIRTMTPANELETVTTENAQTWQEYIIALDISSFSAMILALLFTRLAFVAGRNSMRYFQRDGWSYFQRAYHSVLFTEGFETLCIRMGLLGTLLSFVLAALVHMSGALPESEPARGPRAADPLAQIAQESAGVTEGTANLAESPSQIPGPREFTEKIFVLLCASLVSTFVGTGTAYMITPTLNWLNERAIGLHQIVHADPRLAADEYFRAIALTSQRLAHFETTTAKLSESVGHICSLEENVGTATKGFAAMIANLEVTIAAAAKRLTDLIAGLEGAIKTFDVSTHTGKQLTKKLDQFEAMSDRLRDLFDRLPERLNDPLKNMSLSAGKFREAVLSGEAAFRELRTAAGATSESLGQSTERTNTTWQILHEVQVSLGELARNEAHQTSELSTLVQAFGGISMSLEDLVRGLDLLGPHLNRGNTGDPEAHSSPAARRTRLAEPAGSSSDRGDGHTGSGYRPGHAVTDVARERPWWRRIFG